MLRFVRYVFFVAFGATLCLEILSLLVIASNFQLYLNYPGQEIYNAISLSKQTHKNAKALLIGDSVARQFFPTGCYTDSTISLTSNQAISLCGQYILLENYIQQNPNLKSVELHLTPSSLRNDLNQRYTYHYFLKPFNKKEYRQYFSRRTVNKIQNFPLSSLAQVPHIKATTWAPDFGTTSKDIQISETSYEYLMKIDSTCKVHGLRFDLVPTPVSEVKKEDVSRILTELHDATPSIGNTVLINYFKDIPFFPDTMFEDGIHLAPEALGRILRQF